MGDGQEDFLHEGVFTGPIPDNRVVPLTLWSEDLETKEKAGFHCRFDAARRVFYAAPTWSCVGSDWADEEHSTKGAITALLDVGEACGARRITLGLSPDQAANADYMCALLYLGFQVSPARKSPFNGGVLLLDLDICMSFGGGLSTGTGTGTSDCSTSADELQPLEMLDSD